MWAINLHSYTCILLHVHPECNQKYLHHFFPLPYNDILNPGSNFVKCDGILRVKSRVEYIYRC